MEEFQGELSISNEDHVMNISAVSGASYGPSSVVQASQNSQAKPTAANAQSSVDSDGDHDHSGAGAASDAAKSGRVNILA